MGHISVIGVSSWPHQLLAQLGLLRVGSNVDESAAAFPAWSITITGALGVLRPLFRSDIVAGSVDQVSKDVGFTRGSPS